ncbi:GTPase [Allorhodopirellula solitaria]|uniref:tRNA modification GTPase MnmE n=1 Tax=Allorhodopirellula solitaria TaxID=2527987 RepID=A0A5C5XT42_9BACT|nr:GTPase [Allorhodopirellula solitaria]TWT64882.1 tRNA modification GTPase MnmE [Allorhodopirellula solitaria]
MSETCVSRLTAAGRSAVAVIGVCGPRAAVFISACYCAATQTPRRAGQIRYGTWRPQPDAAENETPQQRDGESVVVTPLAADHFEIHGHGGAAAVSRIMDSLVQLGATPVDTAAWKQHVLRCQGEPDETLIVEAEQVLSQCTTRANAAIALQQYRGALLDWTVGWINRIGSEPHSIDELRTSAAEIAQRQSLGRHLTEPYRVVLAGPPNVGKSSLVNRLVGYGRSITHDEAGTTRDVVDCDTVIGGLPIRLGDTAGIRSGGGVIEQEGIRRGALAIAAADLVLLVIDPSTADSVDAIEQTIDSLNSSGEVIPVLNKADCIEDGMFSADRPQRSIKTIATPQDSGAANGTVDAATGDDAGDGLIELASAIVNRLRPRRLPARAPLPINVRQARWMSLIADSPDAASASERLQALRSGAECS